MSDGGAAGLYEWFDRVGFAVYRAGLHPEFPDVTFHDFESWARTQDWNALLQPLTLYEVDRDNASLALPRRSAGGVAVTSPNYPLNVSPVWVFLKMLEREGAPSLFGLKPRNYFLKDAFGKALI